MGQDTTVDTQELGEKIVSRLLEDLQEEAMLDGEPKMEGRNLSLMLSPKKKV